MLDLGTELLLVVEADSRALGRPHLRHVDRQHLPDLFGRRVDVEQRSDLLERERAVLALGLNDVEVEEHELDKEPDGAMISAVPGLASRWTH